MTDDKALQPTGRKHAPALTGVDGTPFVPSHTLVGRMGPEPISDALGAVQVGLDDSQCQRGSIEALEY
jgi:hypothetical protein